MLSGQLGSFTKVGMNTEFIDFRRPVRWFCLIVPEIKWFYWDFFKKTGNVEIFRGITMTLKGVISGYTLFSLGILRKNAKSVSYESIFVEFIKFIDKIDKNKRKS